MAKKALIVAIAILEIDRIRALRAFAQAHHKNNTAHNLRRCCVRFEIEACGSPSTVVELTQLGGTPAMATVAGATEAPGATSG